MSEELTALLANLDKRYSFQDVPTPVQFEMVYYFAKNPLASNQAFRGCLLIARDSHGNVKLYDTALEVIKFLIPQAIYIQEGFFWRFKDFIKGEDRYWSYEQYIPEEQRTWHPKRRKELFAQIRAVLNDPRPIPDGLGLLGLITDSKEPGFRELALAKLEQIKHNKRESILYSWKISRDPDLEKMVLSLPWENEGNSDEANTMLALKNDLMDELGEMTPFKLGLVMKCWTDADPIIARNASAFLRTIDQERLTAMVDYWSGLSPSSITHKLTGANPSLPYDERRTLIRLRLDLKLGHLANISTELVPHLLQTVNDLDQDIAEASRQRLGELTDPATQQVLCQLVLEKERPELEEIVLRSGYLPPELYQKVLFLF